MTQKIVPEPIARQPWQILIPLALLILLASAVLYSAAGGHIQPWALAHVLRFGVLMVMALLLSRIKKNTLKAISYPLYGIVLALLILVELIGQVGGGSQRWLDLGVITLQPSEFIKPIVILVLAKYYETIPPTVTVSWWGLLPAAMLIGAPMVMVILQPDLGTALAIAFGGIVTVFLAGLPLMWFIGAGVAGAVVAPVAYYALLHDYQRQRVISFLDPESDPLGAGYHIMQSKIAIGSGGFFGKGFGNGSQSHLDYLPEAHTDFVFATMVEEWGMLGGLFILFVFGVIFYWGLSVARKAPDRFSYLLATGMVATMFFYVAINLMMVMGLAPVVGIPLPFMSYGGSAMLTNLVCFGVLMAINRWNSQPQRLS